jgi:hypothetical protein
VANETVVRRDDDTRTKCPNPDKMSDKQLVNYVGKRFSKFLLEMRPYLIEVHTRFIQKKATRQPLLGYRDWDRFCLDFFGYTSRHVRRIISGEALPKPPKKSLSASGPALASAPLPNTVVWTDHDFIHKGAQAIKQILHPLEADGPRYAKVAQAIADEITGDTVKTAPILQEQRSVVVEIERETVRGPGVASVEIETDQAPSEHHVLHCKGEGAQ